MTYSFRYGTKDLNVELPGDRIDVFSSAEIAHSDPSTLVFNAIDHSVPSLEDFLGDSSSVVIVVSDHTRNTGSTVYIPVLLDRARKPGRRITILIALGLHRPSTEAEIAEILGCEPSDDVVVLNHDPDAFLAEFGQGTFSRAAVEAEKVIVTGSVTFHPMAGFSGGWKALLPGIASRECVLGNHGLYFDGTATAPGIGPASMEGNPILSDIRRRTGAFLNKTWCINVVQDESKEIVFASAGPIDRSWDACVAYLNGHNSSRLERLYPVVVASAGGFPSDFSFYQSMKTLTNAARACQPGGKILLLMECGQGWELDESVRSLAKLELAQIASRMKDDFSMSGLAIYMAQSVIRAYEVHCLSALSEREVRDFGMRYTAAVSEIGNIVDSSGADRIAVIPAAAAVLPIFEMRGWKGD